MYQTSQNAFVTVKDSVSFVFFETTVKDLDNKKQFQKRELESHTIISSCSPLWATLFSAPFYTIIYLRKLFCFVFYMKVNCRTEVPGARDQNQLFFPLLSWGQKWSSTVMTPKYPILHASELDSFLKSTPSFFDGISSLQKHSTFHHDV